MASEVARVIVSGETRGSNSLLLAADPWVEGILTSVDGR